MDWFYGEGAVNDSDSSGYYPEAEFASASAMSAVISDKHLYFQCEEHDL